MHPRNIHKSGYDFKKLVEACDGLKKYIKMSVKGVETIDYSNAKAVKMLNKSLLKLHYNVDNWSLPKNYLCPPIPGRVDYIHHIADLLAEGNEGGIPQGSEVKVLDVGVGAGCIYPALGCAEYGWSFIGTDIDQKSIDSSQIVADSNDFMKSRVEFRLQPDSGNIFKGIIQKGEKFDTTICNPPFHSSLKEAEKGNIRKNRNLQGGKPASSNLNFGGQNAELYCEGGEIEFLRTMVKESLLFAENVKWFTSLVSKKDNIKLLEKEFKKIKVKEYKFIEMFQGQKQSRIVAWRYF